jgi:DnaA N-terminal domain
MAVNTWQKILASLKLKVNVQSFSTWLRPTRLLSEEAGMLNIEVPTAEFAAWIEEHCGGMIRAEIAAKDNGLRDVRFIPIPPPAPLEHPKTEAAPELVASRAAPVIPEICWRGIFEEYRKVARKASESPEAFQFAGIAAALSAAIGKSVGMEDPVEMYPNIYACVVGEAGIGKSDPLKFALRKILRNALPTISELPALASAQGLISAIRRHGVESPSTLITLSELRSLIETSSQKSSGDLIPKLNDLFDCVPRLENPTKNSYEEVDNPPPGVVYAATTPVWMEKAKKQDLSGGLGRRFIFFAADAVLGVRVKPQDWSAVTADLIRILEFWRKKKPAKISFDAEAKEAYWKWHDSRPTLKCKHSLIQTLSVGHRGYVLKFAILYAVMDRAEIITIDHLKAATALTDQYSFPCLWHLFADFELSPFGKLEQKIADLVKNNPNRSLRVRDVLWRFQNSQYDRWMIRRAFENVAGRKPDDPDWEGELRIVTVGRKHYVVENKD